MRENEGILVTIQCLVFNHGPFLRKCLDGFVMQKTSFRFEAIVHDDASTDDSASIIREYAEKYPEIIKPIFETENQYSKKDGSLRRIMRNALRGKYIAICEGDDYWTDPGKLQKQADYMEAHPECSLCFHNAIIHWYDGREPDSVFAEIEERDYDGVELCKKWLTPTASYFFKSPIYDEYTRIMNSHPQICIGDSPMLLACAKAGTIHGFPDIMCVYGKHSSGWTQYSDCRRTFQSALSWEAQRAVFGKEYHEVMTDTLTGQYLLTIYRALKEKDWLYAWKGFYRGILRQPVTGIRALIKVQKERKS